MMYGRCSTRMLLMFLLGNMGSAVVWRTSGGGAYWVSRLAEEFLELMVRERVTSLNQTPSAFQQLMRARKERGEGGE